MRKSLMSKLRSRSASGVGRPGCKTIRGCLSGSDQWPSPRGHLAKSGEIPGGHSVAGTTAVSGRRPGMLFHRARGGQAPPQQRAVWSQMSVLASPARGENPAADAGVNVSASFISGSVWGSVTPCTRNKQPWSGWAEISNVSRHWWGDASWDAKNSLLTTVMWL